MTIGTEEGLWYSFAPFIRSGKRGINFSFYCHNTLLEVGECNTEAEMIVRFDALCDAAKRPLC